MFSRFILLHLTWAVIVAAQSSLSPRENTLPGCAQSCFQDALGANLCSPIDTVCMCSSQAFLSNVTTCVEASCGVFESLTTQNITLISCGVPVRDRSENLTIQSAAMFALTIIFVLVRFAYKVCVKLSFGMDDWILLVTFIITIPSSVLFVVGTRPNGLGKDIWTLTATQITDFLKYWYISAIVYFLQTTLVKLTFVTFYMRIFTTRNTRRILWCTFAIVSLWGIAFVILATQVCTPISYMWTQWDGEHKGKCVNDAAYVWTNAATNIALDVWILAVPLWELRRLQLHWKKKIGVALMFSLGALVTVMSILRLKSLALYQHRSTNVTWEFSEIFLWSTIEINVGIICACLPTIRLILVRIWPTLSGSTARRSDRWYRTGKGSDRLEATADSRARASRLGEQRAQLSDSISGAAIANGRHAETRASELNQGPGIKMHKSFSVYYSEGSDISLVSTPSVAAAQRAKAVFS